MNRMSYEYQTLQHTIPPQQEELAKLQDLARKGWRLVAVATGRVEVEPAIYNLMAVLYLERGKGRSRPAPKV